MWRHRVFLENYIRFSKALFVIRSVGDIFLKVSDLTSVVKWFLYGDEEDAEREPTSNAVSCFSAGDRNLAIHASVIDGFSQGYVQELSIFRIEVWTIATVLITDNNNCRNCHKRLVIDRKLHPVVIHSSDRGTYLGCRATKLCWKCKIYEHYGFWTSDGNRYFNGDVLEQEFLLASEDTALDMNLLWNCSNLLVLGAVPLVPKQLLTTNSLATVNCQWMEKKSQK